MDPRPVVLFDGYSCMENDKYFARGSCTLIKGGPNIIVDTLTSWDGEELINALQSHNLTPSDINYVICTHGHSDHTGCNYLFNNATHIVGFDMSHRDEYFNHDFKAGQEYIINDRIKVIPTPGHTTQDVTVLVRAYEGLYAITGDLFECEEDLNDENIWMTNSMSVDQHRSNRQKILSMADFIVPGHGPMFKVNKF